MEIRVLGPIAVVDDRGEQHRVTGRRNRELLCALTLRPGGQVFDAEIHDALWPSDQPEDPDAAVRTYISRLRSQIGCDAVARTGAGYSLVVPRRDVDVWRFEGLATAAIAEFQAGDSRQSGIDLEVALGLWKADPWPELDAASIAEPERQRLRELKAQADEYLVAVRLVEGDSAWAAREAMRLVAQAPLREFRWELAMRALGEEGNRAAALQVYEAARDHILAELGVDPGPRLQRLESALAAGRSLVPLNPQSVLSGQIDHPEPVPMGREIGAGLFGRSRLLNQLEFEVAACFGGDLAVLAITGEVGAGKTAVLEALEETAGPVAMVHRVTCYRVGPADIAEGILEARRGSELAAVGSAIVLADDLQWADAELLDRLAYLVETRGRASVAVVVALRPNEVEQPELLDHLIEAGERAGGYTCHELAGLSLGDAESLVKRTRPGSDPTFARRVFELTDGNPLLTIELARSGEVDPAHQLPTSVERLVERQSRQLPWTSEHLLHVLACSDGPVRLDLLEAVAGSDTAHAVASIEALVASGLVVEAPGDLAPSYDFVHAVYRFAVLGSLSGVRRRKICRDIALSGSKCWSGAADFS